MTATPPEGMTCPCGDYGCDDTFGKATAGQDRTACCQYCGYYDCDVCGWSAAARNTNSSTAAHQPGGRS